MNNYKIDPDGVIGSMIFGDHEDQESVIDAIIEAMQALNRAKLTPLAYHVALSTLAEAAANMVADPDDEYNIIFGD